MPLSKLSYVKTVITLSRLFLLQAIVYKSLVTRACRVTNIFSRHGRGDKNGLEAESLAITIKVKDKMLGVRTGQ